MVNIGLGLVFIYYIRARYNLPPKSDKGWKKG